MSFKDYVLFYYDKNLFKLKLDRSSTSNSFKSSFDIVRSFDEKISSTFLLKDDLFVSTEHYLLRFGQNLNELYYNPYVHIKDSSVFYNGHDSFISLLCKSPSHRIIYSFKYEGGRLSLISRNNLDFPARLMTSFGKHFLVYSDSNYALFSYDDLGVSPILSG